MNRRPDLAAELTDLPQDQTRFAWPDHEYVRGWGVFALPFDSGHVLALRVFPQNDFAPYRTVWHRTPDGSWSIFVDGPRLNIACPRYYGPACTAVKHTRIDLSWVAPAALRITMDEPALTWSVVATTTPVAPCAQRGEPTSPVMDVEATIVDPCARTDRAAFARHGRDPTPGRHA
jgi:hypothetical protein